MKTIICLGFILFSVGLFAQTPLTPNLYYKIPLEKIDQDIRGVKLKNWNLSQKMEYYSERFLGAPYVLKSQGEGVNARYEKEPLMNLKQVDCMTYCEIVIALSLADYYEEMFNILQHIRYRYGIMSLATRNHYTMADWLPANSWCLDDVTRQIGGDSTRQLTRTISHQTFFKNKGIEDIPVFLPDREMTIDYVPLAQMAAAESLLCTGDIVALIQNREGIFAAHMLLVIKKENQTYFRHASQTARKVVDVPFREFLTGLAQRPRIIGMSFIRLKTEIQWRDGVYTHGKFLLP